VSASLPLLERTYPKVPVRWVDRMSVVKRSRVFGECIVGTDADYAAAQGGAVPRVGATFFWRPLRIIGVIPLPIVKRTL